MTDYALVPPGCQYYNPRRQRRHDRRLQMEAALLAKAQEAKRERAERIAQARTKNAAPVKQSFKEKAKGFVSRLFGRKTG